MRLVTGCGIAAAVVVSMASTFVLADHLDHPETRRIVRRLEERNDALLDRIDSWVGERREERMHRAEELIRRADVFDNALVDFRVALRSHPEPWDLRDQAQALIDSAAEIGHVIEHSEYREDLRHEWEAMRDSANELARHYHVKEIGG